MSNHYLICLDEKANSFEEELLPKLLVPQRIEFEDGQFKIIGYFLNYDGKFNSSQILNLLKTENLDKLVNSESEFLLFYLNKKTSIFYIASDQFGRFPCFFHSSKKRLLISSSFSVVKNLLIQRRVKLSVDPDSLFTAVLWSWYSTEKTLLNEIKRVPNGCIIRFPLNNFDNFSMKPLVDLKRFLKRPIKEYDSVGRFAEDWVKTLSSVVRDRLNVLKDLNIGCDLSSGLDCALVSYCLSTQTKDFTCYSRYSSEIGKETIISIVKDFADKNGLKVKTFDLLKFHKYDSNLHNMWHKDDAFQLSATDYHFLIDKLKEDGIVAQFTGDGGDEIYQSKEMDKLPLFPIQASYFENVMYLKKFGVEKLFTQNAVNYALSQDRFNSRNEYPLIISTSLAAVFWSWNEVFWEHNLWLMSPFMDTRLILLARQIPKSLKGNKNKIKKEILKYVGNIFEPAMFGEKYGTENICVNFVKNQKDFIKEVLDDSVLAKIGWIDKQNLLSKLNNKQSDLYSPELSIVFHNLIQLDWFLQVNNIGL